MQRALLLAAFAALALPATAVEERPTTYTQVLDDLVATFGSVPPRALLNGVEVATEDALALLRANAAPLPGVPGLHVPPDDVGFGVRQGTNPCLIGALITATTFSTAQALENESFTGGPGGTMACGPGYAYGTGVGSADVASGTTGTACVNVIVAGSWLNNPSSCQSASGADMVGHVGFVDILIITPFFTYHLEQMFCGVVGWAPGPAGTADACVVAVQD